MGEHSDLKTMYMCIYDSLSSRYTSATLFTIFLAALFPSATGDKLTITKLIAVAMNIGGVISITITDLHDSKMTRGVLLALFSAFFYASYLVFVKRKSDTEEKVDIPLFFGKPLVKMS